MRRLAATRTPTALLVTGAVVGTAMLVPLVHLSVRASEADDAVEVLASERVRDALGATLLLASTVTIATIVLGVGIAWLVERTDLPARRWIGVLASVPLVVPTYIGAVTLRDAFGPRPLLFEIPGVVGFWGAWIALTLSTYPYVLLVARAAMANSDRDMEDVARSLGDGSLRAFRRVVLPRLRPAMAAGGLLVFLYVLSDFGAVSILDYRTLTLAIFTEYRTSFDRSTAALIAVVLVVVTVAAIVGERLVRGRPAPLRAGAGQRAPVPLRLGRVRWPVAALVLCVPALGVGVPVSVLTYRAATAGGRADDASLLLEAATTSVGLSAAAAFAAVAIAVPIAMLAVRHRSAYASVVEGAAVSGYALPGLVVALALVVLASRYVPALYQTLPLVVIAYVVRFLPESLGAVRSTLSTMDPAMEEAARSLGRRPTTVMATVTLPLLRGGLLAGWALVFLTAMKELPATLLLRPAGYDTLATRVWTGAAEGFFSQAALPGLLIVAVSTLALLPLRRFAARPDDEKPVPAS